ncbi:hypothetical protein [Meiothermus taiwanensis]|jgi:RsiW-degrading membrane proteinase PrsW (M82 family)|nr:hypothetical protein [Meiothermus taiwanensis]AWR87223.1 hypothetical protein Mtai_v1c19890 [Meiothermus taiwanensis WR-220]KIQ53490.1 hypothetical protein SY28_13640 [Meiothermus taiwanensis]KZK15359.1 hypothetical protein A3962_10510 [Meiothermus taiwanensis]
MSTFVLAWLLLLVFAAFNNYIIYRLLRERNRTDLMWISAVATVIPVALFALWPGALTLMSFPLLQSIGMLLIMRLAQRQP